MNFIKYKEQDEPIVIDFAVVQIVCAKYNLTLLEFQLTGANPEHMATVCYEGLRRGAKKYGKEFVLTIDDVVEILTESLAEFAEVFLNSVTKMFADPADKKKQ